MLRLPKTEVRFAGGSISQNQISIFLNALLNAPYGLYVYELTDIHKGFAKKAVLISVNLIYAVYMGEYVCVCVCVCVYIHTYIHTYIYMDT
jgi:hypothetical protein